MAAAGIYTATSAEDRLLAQLRDMERERDSWRQQYHAKTDELIRASAELAGAKEQLVIAQRQAARAIAEKEHLFEQLLRAEQIIEERAESAKQAEWLVTQLEMVGA